MRRRAGGHARRGCALADRERQWDLAAVRVRARGALGARRTVVVGAAGIGRACVLRSLLTRLGALSDMGNLWSILYDALFMGFTYDFKNAAVGAWLSCHRKDSVPDASARVSVFF